jgi:hypothetical protein
MSVQNQFQSAATGSLTIRFSTPADVPAVLSFYHANQHHNVDNRGDAVFQDRTEQGRVFLALMPDNSIGASSMSHPFTTPLAGGGTGSSTEIGSTLARVDGFGLYPFIISSQIIHEFLEKPPEGVFFACIHTDNTAVLSLLTKKVGWDVVPGTQEFADAIGEGPNLHHFNWLNASTNTFAHQARIVLAHIDAGYVENRKTGERLNLDLSGFSLATKHRAALTELANGAFGQMLEQSPAKNLRQTLGLFSTYMALKSAPNAPKP